MTAIISHSSPVTVDQGKRIRADEKADKGGSELVLEKPASEALPDTVSLSNAAEALAKSQPEQGQEVIQSAEHASQVAQGLKDLFAGQPGQALAAQAQNVSPGMMGLLRVG